MRDKIDSMKENLRETLTGNTPENDLRARLHQDHAEVANLIDLLIATNDRGDREDYRHKIVMMLTAHAKAEEEVVYSFIAGEARTRGDTAHAMREHRDIEDHLQRIQALDVTGDNFTNAVRELKRVVTHHVHEEENDYLPKAERDLGQDRLATLIEPFEKLRAEILANLPSPADAAGTMT